MTKPLIDPEEITSNYKKTDWREALWLIPSIVLIAYLVAHFVLWLM